MSKAVVTVSVADRIISAHPHTLSMKGLGHDVLIEWNLVTPGWTFPSDGIVITDGDGEFYDLHPSDTATGFSCRNKNSNLTQYHYTITVTDGDALVGRDPTLDPVIVNEE